jgi:hypothetical protein
LFWYKKSNKKSKILALEKELPEYPEYKPLPPGEEKISFFLPGGGLYSGN